MNVLADLPIEPNVIIVFAMVVFAGIKALLEKVKQGRPEQPSFEEEEEIFDPYQHYEAELARQRAERGISYRTEKTVPPPLSVQRIPKAAIPVTRARPSLTPAEKKALANLKLDSPSKRHSGPTTKSRIKKHLASPTAAREALLLSEILGPPKSLQTNERHR